jgi:hypothetical protein
VWQGIRATPFLELLAPTHKERFRNDSEETNPSIRGPTLLAARYPILSEQNLQRYGVYSRFNHGVDINDYLPPVGKIKHQFDQLPFNLKLIHHGFSFGGLTCIFILLRRNKPLLKVD